MAKQGYSGPLERISDCCWRIPKDYRLGMRVEGRIFADDKLIEQIRHDQRLIKWPMSHSCPAFSWPAWPCPTSTGDTGSALEAWRQPTLKKVA